MPWSRAEYEVEVALRSSANLRVPRALLRNGGKYVTRYFISEETGIPNPSRIVENLVRLGWVEEQAISGHRRYRINVENPIKALHEFFAQVGYL